MKKKILAAVSGMLALFALASCGSSSGGASYNGSYWYQSTSDEKKAGGTERTEYNVYWSSGKDGKLWNKETMNASLSFKTTGNDSKYVTELTVNADGTYTYKTTLTISGVYTLADKSEKVVSDTTETEITFKGMEDDFTPIKSVKKIYNTVPYPSAGSYSFLTSSYTSTVNYEGTTAKSSIELNKDDESPEQFVQRAKKEIEVKKYNKNAYMDNGLMLLLFRNFKYDGALNYSFSTIEPLSGELQSVTGSIYREVTSAKDSSSTNQYTVCPIKDVKFDSLPGRAYYTFNVVRMDFSTSGTTGQNFMRAYYAESMQGYTDTKNFTRHLPVMISQPTIFNTGFLVYELSSVSFI